MYDEHPVIQFDTIYEKGLYKIFAMMQVNVEKADGEVFYYTAAYTFKNKKEFIDYYAKVLDRSFIYTPQVDLKYGDEVIALSTCDFPFGKSKNIRYVLLQGECVREKILRWMYLRRSSITIRFIMITGTA